MKRLRLKNIIEKSKGFSDKKVIGESFDEFVKSLPKELDSYKEDNYRLEAAWKAYGKPKDYKSALWEGLILPIDENTFKMPSIGYNEETGEYEYLNTGKENDTVAKDIRVWDNDVIPFVKELKLGGYIRQFDEEKNCWIYQKGGKTLKKERKYKTFEELKKYLGDRGNSEDYDLEGAYNDDDVYFDWENEEENNPGNGHWSDKYKLPNHPTFSTESVYSNKVTQGGTWKTINGLTIFETSPWIESQWPLELLRSYFLENEPNIMLVYNGQPYLEANGTLAFKLGGQLNVIPEGALHARKNNMEGAGKDFTAKGIPVVDNEGNLQAEIERNEIIFRIKATEIIEEAYKEFYSEDTSQADKDDLAIEIGKFLVKEIIHKTDDKTGLILLITENK